MLTSHCTIVSSKGKNGDFHYVYSPVGYKEKGKRLNLGCFKTHIDAEIFKYEWETAHRELWEKNHQSYKIELPKMERRSPGEGSIKIRNGKYQATAPRNKKKGWSEEILGLYDTYEDADKAIKERNKEREEHNVSCNPLSSKPLMDILRERALGGDEKALDLLIKKSTIKECMDYLRVLALGGYEKALDLLIKESKK